MRSIDLTAELFPPELVPAVTVDPFIVAAREKANEMLRVPPGPARRARQRQVVECLKAATSRGGHR